jgi:hypothetical protein
MLFSTICTTLHADAGNVLTNIAYYVPQAMHRKACFSMFYFLDYDPRYQDYDALKALRLKPTV